ncbi:hypothetical protein [Pedobacter sp.]
MMYHQIHRILEEGDIYSLPRACDRAVWEFVEANSPGYHSSGDIACNDDLSKMVSGELTGDAATLFWGEYGGDLGKVLVAYDKSCREIYERAILGYLKEEPQSIAIRWSVTDVEERARENGYQLKPGEALKVLELLKERHDASVGITWDTIDDYLSYIVPFSDADDGLKWHPVKFSGREFLCRVIADQEWEGSELLVAPILLKEEMDAGDADDHVTYCDEKIVYYASETELLLGDAELYRLIYS